MPRTDRFAERIGAVFLPEADTIQLDEDDDPAVGQPPITRWDFADYSVFFEYQHVIHAVPKRGG